MYHYHDVKGHKEIIKDGVPVVRLTDNTKPASGRRLARELNRLCQKRKRAN